MTKIPVKQNPPQQIFHQVPPYNGYGSEEDSLLNTKIIIPRLRDSTQNYVPARVKNVTLSYKNDKHILRFSGKLISSNPADQERNFIISFYCKDETVLVFELAARNSGRESCKFMERGNHKNPITGSYYRENDFQVGKSVFLKSFIFKLLDCDEYTKNYMKVHNLYNIYNIG